MATTVIRTAAFRAPPVAIGSSNLTSSSPKFVCLPLRTRKQTCPKTYRTSTNSFSPQFCRKLSPHHRLLLNSACFASSGETTETQEAAEVQDSQLENNSDGNVAVEDDETVTEIETETTDAEEPSSAVIASLESYKEALASNDMSTVAEVETLLKSIEDEKIALENKVVILSEEMSYEKDRVLRISADFDNFRKRTERERLSLVTNAKGEVVENLLPVLDNFERAKAQIKVETEGEDKINNSYQSIYKQFVEILGSLGVVPVETTGSPFDPMLHEAIMREDSAEFEEGIILQEFRKGFKLGDRLLRPSMVKVSAGPGPAKSESAEPSEESEGVNETEAEGSPEAAPVEDQQ